MNKGLEIPRVYNIKKGELPLDRCDFSSISTCLKNHISESNQMSQPDFLYELFEDFMNDPAMRIFLWIMVWFVVG